MGASKKVFMEDFAKELEAQKVARQIPDLVFEAEHMWLLLNEIRESIKIGEPLNHYPDKIDELESRMPSIFIKNMKDDDFDVEGFVKEICD